MNATDTKQKQITEIRNAALDMMAKVKFDEAEHLYTRTDNGAWLQGVSTVSSIVPKDWLSAWGAKEAVKALGFSDFAGDTAKAVEVLSKIKMCETVEEYLAILKDAKGASARKSKEALVDGTAGHAWCEEWIKANIRGKKLPELPEGMLERPLRQFVQWAQMNVDTWILSEARVAHLEQNYAGTLDALAIMKTGKLAVVDLKFASHISEDYYLQTAGYQATFEPYGIQIDERWIVRLPKTLEKQEWMPKERKYKMVENTIEAYKVETPYELDRDAFFACLPVKKWINAVTNKK